VSPPPRWRQILPVLLAVQAVLAATALVWGLLRDLEWWRQIAPTWAVLGGLMAGTLLSLASNAGFRFLARRRLAGSDWLLNGLMGPLFQGLPLTWALGLSLLSAACEEALFRGVLQVEFGLWSSSALFGLLHTGDRRLWLSGLWATAMGLILGLSWQATGNLAVPMALHAASNLYSFLQLARWRAPEA
jgi:membrane protease YdiL (CAAX protease family)